MDIVSNMSIKNVNPTDLHSGTDFGCTRHEHKLDSESKLNSDKEK